MRCLFKLSLSLKIVLSSDWSANEANKITRSYTESILFGGCSSTDLSLKICHKVDSAIKPGSHMLPMIGESLSVIIQGEN